MLGRAVPYTGSIYPHVRELEPGHARVTMADRRAVRNHLKSVHAIALVNLGEFTSGLAMLAALPPGVRSIVTSLNAEFIKKGRGTLTAECRCAVPSSIGENTQHIVTAEVLDSSGDVVARVRVTWLLSPPA
jgi:acyl-coenzyme A thioesterase PaaI-like protein